MERQGFGQAGVKPGGTFPAPLRCRFNPALVPPHLRWDSPVPLSPLFLCKSSIPPFLRAAAQAHPSSLPQSQLLPHQVHVSLTPLPIPTASAFTSAPARAASAPPLLHPFIYLFAPQKSSSAWSFSCFSLLLPLSGAAGGRLSHRLSLLPRQPFRRPSADYQNFSLGCSKTFKIFPLTCSLK